HPNSTLFPYTTLFRSHLRPPKHSSQKSCKWIDVGSGVRSNFLHGWYRRRVGVPLRRTLLAFSRAIERQHRSAWHAQCEQGANHGSHGCRHRAEHFFYSAGSTENATGTDSVGRIRERNALCSRPPEG